MKARKKPLEITTLAELGVAVPTQGLRTSNFALPAVRSRGVLVKDAAELVTALKQRGVL